MKVTYKRAPKKLTKTDCLVVLGFQDSKLELPEGVSVPAAARADFKGELRQVRPADASGPAARVLMIGLGKRRELDLERLRRAGALASQRAEAAGVSQALLWTAPGVLKAVRRPLDESAVGCALAEGAAMGAYGYEDQKSKPKPRKLKGFAVAGGGAALQRGVARGGVLAAANSFTRDLQNAPGNVMTPRRLAAEARKLAGRSPRIRCTVMDEARMKELKMGLLLGVSRGSVEPARLIHLVYKPKGRPKGKVCLVGKGLTFDAGGISIKPAAKMDEMRFDMSGGAAVLGLFHALAGIDVPYEVHGIVGATENLADAAATKPGDVHTAMDGTTVEILNTDAEGRLVLGDALAYAVKKVRPDTIVDLATLTGAVIVALGHELSGMFATTEKLRDELSAAGEEVGERVWPLPLDELHKEKMKGASADLRNIGPGDMGAGSTQGAAFLSYFVGDTEWAHLDIAGTAWGTTPRDWVGGPGGTGVGARLLLRYLELRS